MLNGFGFEVHILKSQEKTHINSQRNSHENSHGISQEATNIHRFFFYRFQTLEFNFLILTSLRNSYTTELCIIERNNRCCALKDAIISTSFKKQVPRALRPRYWPHGTFAQTPWIDSYPWKGKIVILHA